MSQDFKPLASLLDAAMEAPLPTPTWQDGESTRPEKLSGVPRRRQDNTFSSFDLALNKGLAEAYSQCQRVAEGDAWCALLAGPPGTGKTHLAVAAMHKFGMLRSMFWKVPDFLDWLKRMAFDENYPLETLIRPYRDTDILLVLDDLGVENNTDWAHEQLYRVLDSRYDNELPTIITTNQPRNRLDPRLLSRYAEGLVVCEGQDIRRR